MHSHTGPSQGGEGEEGLCLPYWNGPVVGMALSDCDCAERWDLEEVTRHEASAPVSVVILQLWEGLATLEWDLMKGEGGLMLYPVCTLAGSPPPTPLRCSRKAFIRCGPSLLDFLDCGIMGNEFLFFINYLVCGNILQRQMNGLRLTSVWVCATPGDILITFNFRRFILQAVPPFSCKKSPLYALWNAPENLNFYEVILAVLCKECFSNFKNYICF